MKRRAFIGKVALAPAALTGFSGWLSRASVQPQALTFAAAPKRKITVPLHEVEEDIIRFLRPRGDAVYLYGSPIYAALSHGKNPWSNLLLSGGDFTRVKSDLFRKGVQPISTLELQPTFIKFFWKDRLFNLVNADVEEVCQANYVLHKSKGLPFAHNYLAYDLATGALYDPYEAVSNRQTRGIIRLILAPGTLAEGFDIILAGHFDARLLGLSPGEELRAFERKVLDTACPASQSCYVAERILNYYPDIVEKLGIETAAGISESRLVNGALRQSLGVDFRRTHDELLARTRGSRFKGSTGREFMAVLHQQIGSPAGQSLFASRVCHFLMRNDFSIRCPEWISGTAAA
jgi:hypothetical protein